MRRNTAIAYYALRVLGSRRFQAEVADMVGRRVTQGKAGRSPKDPLPKAKISSVRIRV